VRIEKKEKKRKTTKKQKQRKTKTEKEAMEGAWGRMVWNLGVARKTTKLPGGAWEELKSTQTITIPRGNFCPRDR